MATLWPDAGCVVQPLSMAMALSRNAHCCMGVSVGSCHSSIMRGFHWAGCSVGSAGLCLDRGLCAYARQVGCVLVQVCIYLLLQWQQKPSGHTSADLAFLLLAHVTM